MARQATLIAFLVCAACTGRIETPVNVPALPGDPGSGGGTGGSDEPGDPPCEIPNPLPSAPVPMRRLLHTHVERAVHDVLGVDEVLPVADEKLFTFRSNISAPVDDAAATAYLDYAEKVVGKASFASCTDKAACKTWVIDDLGRRLFRRPLDGDLRQRYAALYETGVTKGGSPADGAKWVVQAMLQSPAFLYFDEPMNGDGYLDGYGVATRLAQSLWGSNPDGALLDAASRGDLDTAEGVRAKAVEMLADPKSAGGFETFVGQWLDLERLRQVDARPDLVALGADALVALEHEPVEVFKLAVKNDATLGQLFTTPRTVPLPALAALYGADVLSTNATETQLDPAVRAGLFTLPGVMASLSHAGATSPTLRGHAILANVMCTPPPPPPAGVVVTLPETDPNATTRERLEAHFSDPSCASCHKSMDGMGFAFEKFDALGKSRSEDKGRPVDDRGEFYLGGESVQVKGAIELSGVIAERPEVHNCFAAQWTRYASGIPERPELKCYVKSLASKLNQPGGLSAMMVELAASDYLRKGAVQ